MKEFEEFHCASMTLASTFISDMHGGEDGWERANGKAGLSRVKTIPILFPRHV